MTTADTKRAEYRFRVKEYGDGTPWIYLELVREPDLPTIAPGFLGLDLKEGTSYEEAKEIARFLNERITTVSHTYFIPEPDQKKPF